MGMLVVQLSSPQPVKAEYATACSLSSITGTYGFVLTGWVGGTAALVPLATSGYLTANGAGKLTGDGTTVESGSIFPLGGLTGTYTVNANCTGTAAISSKALPTVNVNFVIVAARKQLVIIDTDNGSTITGTATHY
jgi:hypothetical protein